jgi:hypothetical protein
MSTLQTSLFAANTHHTVERSSAIHPQYDENVYSACFFDESMEMPDISF